MNKTSRKTLSLLIAVTLLYTTTLIAPIAPIAVGGDTATTTGNFTTGATLSIEVNRSWLAFGEVGLDTNKTRKLQVNNTGTANCSVTLLGENGTGNWTLENGTDLNNPTGFNEFYVVANSTAPSYPDHANQSITWSFTVFDDLRPSGGKGQYGEPCDKQPYNVTLCVSTKTDEASELQQFYMNLTAAAVT